MRIALVHQNFPGQFRDLLPGWLRQGHQIIGIGCTEFESSSLPVTPGSFSYFKYDGCADFRLANLNRLLTQLILERVFCPEIIVAHSAWGEAVNLKRFWPNAKIIIYPELWGTSAALGFGFDAEQPYLPPPYVLKTIRWQNSLASRSFKIADAVVVPSIHQHKSFPIAWRKKLHLICEGVDCSKLKPKDHISVDVPSGNQLISGQQVITFCCREFEPLRGAHIFLNAAAELLRVNPSLQILVIGGDGKGYRSTEVHAKTRAGKFEHLVKILSRHPRMHFMGNVDHEMFCSLLQVSKAHVYLSYPYTLSWSVLEAMACGTPLITNKGGPAEDLIMSGKNGYLVNFNDPMELIRVITDIMSNETKEQYLRRNARETAMHFYSLESSLRRYEELFSSLLTNGSLGPIQEP